MRRELVRWGFARWLPRAGSAVAALLGAALVVIFALDAPPPSARADEPEGAPAAAPAPSLRRALEAGRPVALRTGFIPDPFVVRGTVAPQLSLTRLGGDCRGLASAEPTQRVTMDGPFGFLRIFATGPADLTLAVQTSSGVVCSNDQYGRHPAIEGRFAAGELAIWVGVIGDVEPERRVFELELTETRSIRPGVRGDDGEERLALAVSAGLDVAAETGTSGDLRLSHGFLPDPRFLAGAVEAPRGVDVTGLTPRCVGRVPGAPSHALTLQDDHDFLQIYVVEAPDDATLVVVGPDGSFDCDSSTGGRAQVARDAWPAGVYRIYVGAPSAEATFTYRLGLSEIRRVR